MSYTYVYAGETLFTEGEIYEFTDSKHEQVVKHGEFWMVISPEQARSEDPFYQKNDPQPWSFVYLKSQKDGYIDGWLISYAKHNFELSKKLHDRNPDLSQEQFLTSVLDE